MEKTYQNHIHIRVFHSEEKKMANDGSERKVLVLESGLFERKKNKFKKLNPTNTYT